MDSRTHLSIAVAVLLECLLIFWVGGLNDCKDLRVALCYPVGIVFRKVWNLSLYGCCVFNVVYLTDGTVLPTMRINPKLVLGVLK